MIAATPPMGWNSWDCFGTTVTEDEVVANAEFMAKHLRAHGWDTVVVDIAWYDPQARAHGYNDGSSVLVDEWGRQIPDERRFPSAAGGRGFGPLAQRLHAMDLKLGLHVMRGIPRVAVERDLPVAGTTYSATDVVDLTSVCTWNWDNYGLDHRHDGAQAYYDSQVEQFARWGVDFIKLDDVLHPFHADAIASYSRAISRSGREMLLSLSPGRHLSTAHLDLLRSTSQMWRISDDLWDRWEDLSEQFGRLARWAPMQRPGAWADADMLPLGRIGIRAERGDDRMSLLTRDEQRTMMTLWVTGRSPLMFGGDLPCTDAETLALLTNDDVLRILNHSAGNQEVLREGDLVAWTARATDSDSTYGALFWLGEHSSAVTMPVGSLGVSGARRATDLWSGEPVSVHDGQLRVDVPAHGCRLFRFDRG
jgi:hypothetical protein